MSLFNLLIFRTECPRCHQNAEFEIEMRFGDTSSMSVYRIGDQIGWKNEKHSENGNLNGEGYAECLFCCKDFFVKVIIRNNIFSRLFPKLIKRNISRIR